MATNDLNLCDGISDGNNGKGLNIIRVDSSFAHADTFECFLRGILFITVIINIISINYYVLTTTHVLSRQPNQENKKLRYGSLPRTAPAAISRT